MTSPARQDRYCVVGAGPGGLAMARAFRRVGVEFDLYERLPGIGGIWDIANPESPMYQRIRLVSPAGLSGFPGYPMPAGYPDYPTHYEVLRYLRGFAGTLDLDGALRLGTEVTAVRPDGEGWRVTLRGGGSRSYAGVVLACGHTWTPQLPPYAGDFAGAGIHSLRYHSPEPYAGKSVLVVGGGNSGCDIACDLVGTAGRVLLSLRRGYFFLPRYVRRLPIAEWALTPDFSERVLGAILGRQLRLLDPLGVPRPTHRLFEANPVVNDEIIDAIMAGDIAVRGDIAGFAGNTARFTDGTEEAVDAVIFATGYQFLMPVLGPLLSWRAGRPSLYATMFHPDHDRLFILGLSEGDGAAFPLLSAQAEVVARLAVLRGDARDRARALIRRTATADLSGGRSFVASHRHTISVNCAVYLNFLERLAEDLDAVSRARRPHAGSAR